MGRKLGYLMVVVALAIPAAAARPGSISGYVKNSAGVPQMGAVVRFCSMKRSTGSTFRRSWSLARFVRRCFRPSFRSRVRILRARKPRRKPSPARCRVTRRRRRRLRPDGPDRIFSARGGRTGLRDSRIDRRGWRARPSGFTGCAARTRRRAAPGKSVLDCGRQTAKVIRTPAL